MHLKHISTVSHLTSSLARHALHRHHCSILHTVKTTTIHIAYIIYRHDTVGLDRFTQYRISMLKVYRRPLLAQETSVFYRCAALTQILSGLKDETHRDQ